MKAELDETKCKLDIAKDHAEEKPDGIESLIATVSNSVADPGCLSWIPDPNFTHPGSRIQKQQQKREVKKN
jgi:hypothetical protein